MGWSVGAVKLCPPGEKGVRAGRHLGRGFGTYTASTTQFTFACASGTIAKCTPWGSCPFGSAQLSDGDGRCRWPIIIRPHPRGDGGLLRRWPHVTRDGTQVDILQRAAGTRPDRARTADTRHRARLPSGVRVRQAGRLRDRAPPLPGAWWTKHGRTCAITGQLLRDPVRRRIAALWWEHAILHRPSDERLPATLREHDGQRAGTLDAAPA